MEFILSAHKFFIPISLVFISIYGEEVDHEGLLTDKNRVIFNDYFVCTREIREIRIAYP